ncbi:metacaspase-3-like isoform X2 [Lycium barbarum]|uniref:metacaspase-3-like isoform X2 n=1 Tax=Lycium barbarum TaxID=112863 RepID=UPI00293E09A0|nr:metacaspase-3-like isoform X2 [Lycium barbarum]
MDRRICKCKWCGMIIAAPIGAQTITCPRCQSVTQLQPPRNNSFANFPTPNNNMRPEFPAFPARPGRMSPNPNNFPTANNNMNPEFPAYPARPGRMNPNANSSNFPTADNNMSPGSPAYPARPGRINPNGNSNNFPTADDNMSPGFPAYPARPRRMSPNTNNIQPQQFNIMSPQINNIRAPTVHGRKRAVLCGINYRGHPKSLKGSINDVLSMRYFLVNKLGFPNASVIFLTEDEKDPYKYPTKANIRSALRWLVHGCRPGDSLVFHYSGHGARVRDRDGDEIDGHDESLCPVDYETEGRILDDEINSTIVRPLPCGATLHGIIDACFSGTSLDLPFVCRINRAGYFKWEDHRISSYKGTRGGTAISISACDDHQSSGDTTAFTGVPMGALTYSFIQTLEQETKLSYGRLIMRMHNKIDEAQKRLGLNGANETQEPQLSSSEPFDIHSKLVAI